MIASDQKGLLAWFARNHHAANLLMVVVLAVGIISLLKIKQEVFPVFVLDTVEIEVQYRGAAPRKSSNPSSSPSSPSCAGWK